MTEERTKEILMHVAGHACLPPETTNEEAAILGDMVDKDGDGEWFLTTLGEMELEDYLP